MGDAFDRSNRTKLLQQLDRAAELLAQGSSAEAEGLLRQTYLFATTALGADDVGRVLPLRMLGKLYRESAKYDQAEETYQIASKWLNGHRASTGSEAALLEHELTHLEYSRGRLTEAEFHARTAIALQSAGRSDSFAVTTSEVVLAMVLKGQGRYEEAEELLRSAIIRFRTGPDTPSWALGVSLHYLGIVFTAIGHSNEAIDCYEEAVAIKQRHVGSTHPSVLGSIHNLALIYVDTGRPDEAAALWDNARTLLRAVHDEYERPAARCDCPACS